MTGPRPFQPPGILSAGLLNSHPHDLAESGREGIVWTDRGCFTGTSMSRAFLNILFSAGVGAVFLLGGVSTSLAQDWPGWRGADRSDRSGETGLLAEWPDGGPEKLWTNSAAGLGYAGFAVVANRLYTMGLEDDKEFALCLDASTGEEIWRQPIGEKYENHWGDGPRSTPTVDGERVYFMAAGGALSCLEAAAGKNVWTVQMTEVGGSVPDWGYAESPLVDGDLVVCTPGGDEGAIAAFDKNTGNKKWQTAELTQGAHYSSLIAMESAGKKQYVQLLVNQAVGVEPESGAVLWKADFPGRTAVIPTPVDVDGKAYFTAGYGAGSMLVQPGTDGTAEVLWQDRKVKNHHGGMILVDGHLYGHSDRTGFVCQRATDGELVWNNRDVDKGCMTWADGRFYHVEEDSGDILLIEASPEKLSLRGKFTMDPQTERRKPDGRVWVHPVVAGGRLYVRDQELIHCYRVSAAQ